MYKEHMLCNKKDLELGIISTVELARINNDKIYSPNLPIFL